MTRQMERHVALLRAVNVGGAKVVMAELRAAAEAIGFAEPATVLQSGSLVFSAAGQRAAVETKIEAMLVARFGVTTDVMVRSAEAWQRVVADNPFATAASDDPAHLLVLALKGSPKADAEVTLRRAIRGPEKVVVAYAIFPDGIGRSKLTPAVLERHLGTRCTGRNWSTALKIAALLGL